MKTVTIDQVRARIGNATLLEALPEMYFRKGHLPGAIHFPHDQVDALEPVVLGDKDAEILVYCANAACKNSGIAAERLTALGYRNVSVFVGGKKEWEEAGLSLERSIVGVQLTL